MSRISGATEFLEFLIRASVVFDVDEDHYVTNAVTGQRHTIGTNPPGELVVVHEGVDKKNAYIVNAFAEAAGNVPSSIWFYKLLRTSVNGKIIAIMEDAINIAVAQKDGAGSDNLAPAILDLVSVVANDVDKKTPDELKLLMKSKMESIIDVASYDRHNLSCSVVSALLQNPDDIHIKKIGRKKTVTALQNLLMKILNISEPSELSKFTCEAGEDGPPKLSSTLKTLYLIVKEINKYLIHLDTEQVIDLTTFKNHLDNIGVYASAAKYIAPLAVPNNPNTQAPVQNNQTPVQNQPGQNAPQQMPWAQPPAQQVPQQQTPQPQGPTIAVRTINGVVQVPVHQPMMPMPNPQMMPQYGAPQQYYNNGGVMPAQYPVQQYAPTYAAPAYNGVMPVQYPVMAPGMPQGMYVGPTYPGYR